MTPPTPRDYQIKADTSIFDAWDRGVQRPALVLPTGTGKTVVFSGVARKLVRVHRRRPGILVHRDELVDQAVEKMLECDPGLSVGVVKAERNELWADVLVLSVQTLHRRLGRGRKAVPADRITDMIVDEAHHAAAASYLDCLDFFGCMDANSDSRALGVSATLARADGVPLGHVWQEVCFEYSIVEAMEAGYLVPAHAERAVLGELDLSKVKSKGGDWAIEDLGGKMFKAGSTIAESLLQHGRGFDGRLRRTIVFAPTVACAQMWAEDFAAAGIRSRVVTGNTSKDERRAAYKATAAGDNDALISVMVLTEGFDLPSAEIAVIGRPTKSLPLYTQMVGRVLRPSPKTGKTSALILDVCGVMNDKLTTLIDLGLPPACECACDCDFAHLCPQGCNCPRDIRGRLKKPCILCARTWVNQPREERQPCPHYVGGHVINCRHRCEGFGKPGIHEPDDPTVILDPEEPDPLEVLIDDSEITTKTVDLFDLTSNKARRVAAAPKPKPKAWRLTKNGRPYLPSTSTFEHWVFLHQFPDPTSSGATWSVGIKPKSTRGLTQDERRPKMLGSNLTFADAVALAEQNHPSGGKLGRPLAGLPSEAQLAMLRQNKIEVPKDCTKQQASDLLGDLFASRALD